jgi:hypothetical protein
VAHVTTATDLFLCSVSGVEGVLTAESMTKTVLFVFDPSGRYLGSAAFDGMYKLTPPDWSLGVEEIDSGSAQKIVLTAKSVSGSLSHFEIAGLRAE